MALRELLLFIGSLLLGGSQAASEPMCTPTLAVRDVIFSDIEFDQRTWSARIAVDAARCASASGRFNIRFVRLKENAPDENFREQFRWTPGGIEVSTLFAADEAVLDYAVEAVACPCRR